MSEHRGPDHRGIERPCIQEIHACWDARDDLARWVAEQANTAPASPLHSEPRFYETSPYTGGPRLVRSRKLYRTIVADPPWAFQQKWLQAKKGNALTHDGLAGIFRFGGARGDAQAGIRGAAAQYQTMSMNDIAALPVSEWADVDAHLYLWTPNAFVLSGEAQAIARAWGFEPYQLLTWGKGHADGRQQLGMGMMFRNTTEQLIFAYRGKRGRPGHSGLPTLFMAPRGRHSEKPGILYDYAEVMSPGPYLDVFARRHRFGWDTFGLEVFNEPELLETLDERQRAGLVAKGGS